MILHEIRHTYVLGGYEVVPDVVEFEVAVPRLMPAVG
jgi:hypothetical protein